LKATSHANIVKLLDVDCEHGSLDLIFEYLPVNLRQHMEGHGQRLQPRAVCSLQRQLLLGLDFCHTRRILHRDLKPANLLIEDVRPGGDGHLKIADFGMARAISMRAPPYTPGMVTSWYRPPEILFGGDYTLPVDIWSAGCILGEMLRGGVPLFYGSYEIEVMMCIFRKLGTPDGEVFPQDAFPHFKPKFPKFAARSWEEICGDDAHLSPDCVQLLGDMLRYDPVSRISAKSALMSPYFAGIAAPTL